MKRHLLHRARMAPHPQGRLPAAVRPEAGGLILARGEQPCPVGAEAGGAKAAFVCHVEGGRKTAAEVVQEVFLVLVERLPQFRYDPAKSFRGWLRTILVNKWKNRNRARA